MPEHNCEECGLDEGCLTPRMEPDVKGSGTDVMIIGEAPGADEDKRGVPFVGRSGQLLRDAMNEVGLHHSDWVLTNTVRCRPPDNVTPTAKQRKCCWGLLEAEIERYDPGLIILLGNSPLKAVLGESGITNWRGTLVERQDRTYLPTFHPAYILRNNSALQVWVEDLDMAYQYLDGELEVENASANYDIEVVENFHQAAIMAECIRLAGVCGFDTETATLKHYSGSRLLMMSFAVNAFGKKRAWAIDVTRLDDIAMERVHHVLQDADIMKIAHNAKFDVQAVRAAYGYWVNGEVGDSMVVSYLIDPVPGRHGLKNLAGRYLGMYDYDLELREYKDSHPEADYAKGGDYSHVPSPILTRYAALDALSTLETHQLLIKQLTSKQQTLYEQVLIPISMVLSKVERNGVMIDQHITRRYIKIYQHAKREYYSELLDDPMVKKYVAWRTAKLQKGKKKKPKPFVFNPGSSYHMRDILFDRRFHGLKVTAKTKTKLASTEWDNIKGYANEVPMLGPYRLYKLMTKMIGTYLEPFVGKWLDDDGRVRANYNLDGTATGRLSSSSPNLQNIPTPEKEPGTLLAVLPIKNIFTHTWEDGCVLAVDYSGMELRTMASLSQCAEMLRIFRDGLDLHSIVTEFLNEVKQANYSEKAWKALRYEAKWVNWTLFYGGGWSTLVRIYGIDKAKAKRMEITYYDWFPEVLDYREMILAGVRENGYVESPFGRRRYMPYINDKNFGLKAADERAAVNMPVQSAASEVLLCALIILSETMEEMDLKSLMVNTVYDSAMFDVFPGELDDLAWLCKHVLENMDVLGPKRFPGLDFSWLIAPLVADLEIGSHYGTLDAYEVKQ